MKSTLITNFVLAAAMAMGAASAGASPVEVNADNIQTEQSANGKIRHVKIQAEFPAGGFTEYFAVNQEILRQAQLWESTQPKPEAWDAYEAVNALSIWLANHGAQLDRKDGPAVVRTFEGITTEEWYSQGKLNRENGPAIVETSNNNNDRTEKWYRQGELHREDGPAVIETSPTRNRQEWYRQGLLDRNNGPAAVGKNPYCTSEEWYSKGQKDRENGPAVSINCIEEGTRIEYWRHGQLDRKGAPAFIGVARDGSRNETWLRHNRIDRKDGPAIVETRADGSLHEAWVSLNKRH